MAVGQVCHSYDPAAVDSFIAHEHAYKTEAADSIGLAPTSNYDIVYHRLAVSLDPAVRYISGSVTSYFKPVSSLSQIAFDLTDSLQIDSVVYHHSALAYTHTSQALTITLPSAISTLDSLTTYYHGVPPATGFGSFNKDVHNSVPVLWTLSEPYGARDWFPCKMTLLDKVDSLDTYVSMPAGNRAASNGLLWDTARIGNTVTYHWRHRYPVATYLIGIAVTNYDTFSHIVPTVYGDIKVLDYVYPENKAEWVNTNTDVAACISLYSQVFGPYPFIKEKYGQAQFNWAGGMEHQTMSFVYNLNYDLMNHEMAHQWFGDKLTCGSWADIWLNEGFAVFSSGLCYEHLQRQYWYIWRYNNMTRGLRKGTTFCDDTTSVPRIFDSYLTYSKGAFILHMLRGVLGDTDFFKALKDYVADPVLAYHFSKTELLKQHMEQQSGLNLTQFFRQWIYTGGYPSYQLEWSQHGSALAIKLSQSTTYATVSFFAMPVPVKCYGGGRDTTYVLDHTSSGQQFSLSVPFSIDSIVIDPEIWIISANNSVRKLPAIDRESFITIYPTPVKDVFTIWFDSQTITRMSYAVYNMQGQKVFNSEVQPSGDYYTGSLGNLAPGVYVVKVSTNKGTYTQRISKI